MGLFSKQVANLFAPATRGSHGCDVESEGGSSASALHTNSPVPAPADPDGVTALHRAASTGDLDALSELLQHHDPDVIDRWGQTPLYYAATAQRGQGAIELLIEHGANPHHTARTGRSPLQQAAAAGSGLTLRSFLGVLLKFSVARYRVPQIKFSPSQNPQYAQSCNFEHLSECLRLAAANKNADTLAALIKFVTPVKRVHWLDQPYCLGPIGKAAPALVSAEQARTLARRAVIWVAQTGNSALLRELKRRGVNLNTPNERRFSPLLRLAYHGDCTGVEALLKAGVDVNARGPRGYTALHLAAAMGHSELVQLLRKKGANANAQNDRGHIPLETAIVLDKLEGIQALRKPRTLGERLGITNPQRLPRMDMACSEAAEAVLGWGGPFSAGLAPIDESVRAEVRSAE